ncbi:MAG TPA: AAA-like domain-containing protein [Gammaproteobacteria bacterium]
MPRTIHAGEFFVVGGPVQPGRACYIERDADRELPLAVAEQRFCYVLAPRATGKSSLMARAIAALRRDGQLAAMVDLTQIGARGDNADPGRWYYSIAYRIVRELRLKVDLQSWWQEKSTLGGEQRLAEFFFEIVLANTAEAVTVFIDEVERALDLSFSQELFAAIHTCYTRRLTEPDYGRLNFVVLGTASVAALCPDSAVSPFVDGVRIELKDFTREQCEVFAAGLGVDEERSRGLLDRIYGWTSGHPYFTQKIARAVARKGGRFDDVDRVVREQFLAPGVVQEEPLLSHMRAVLTERKPAMRQSLALLAKIAKGQEAYADPSSPAVETLLLSGVVAVERRRLRYRNRICAHVFGSRWANSVLPFDWRTASAVAALVATAILVPFWYTQFLPRPYIRTLTVVNDDVAVAEQAYERLHRLPGFARTADRLLAEAMARRSARASTYAEAMAADAVLRRLPGQQAFADRLLGEFWLRQSDRARHAERRDEALLYALQALPAKLGEVRATAAELIGYDYRQLRRSFRLPVTPARWEPDWQSGHLTVVDPANRVQRLGLEDHGGRGEGGAADRLTALQHVPVRREVSVDDAGSAGAFVLLLDIRHPSPDDVLVTLTAPSGAQASLPLGARAEEGTEPLAIPAAAGGPLAALSDEDRRGVWRLTVVDRELGDRGTLAGWGLRFPGGAEAWRDDVEPGIPIPDPVRTEQVTVELSGDGRLAVARPSREGAGGALALWNLAEGRLQHDLQMPVPPDLVTFNAPGTRLLVQTGNVLTLWDVTSGTEVAQLATQSEFLLPPALDPDGDYVAIAERVDGGEPLISLLRVEDGALVASIDGMQEIEDWVLGPQARYLALLDGSRAVRVIDPRSGAELAVLPQEREVRRLLPVPAGDLIVTIDAGGEMRSWPLPVDAVANGPPVPTRLGYTVDPAHASVAAKSSVIAYEAEQGHVIVRDIRDSGVHDLRVERRGVRLTLKLAPHGEALVTSNGRLLRVWSLEDADPVPGPYLELTAAALDEDARIAALGFRGGNVRVRSSSELEREGPAPDTVDYIGHRGAVTALALDAQAGLVASGGSDGVVRVWPLATVAPTPHFMRHPTGPVAAVAISGDGRWLASAAEYSARIWRVADGTLAGEVPVNGSALAVAFAPDSSLVAVGDSAGNLFFAEPTGTAPLRSARAQSAVQTLAFSPDGRLVATGDDTGTVQLWDPQTAAAVGEAHVFPQPVRWLDFNADGSRLFVHTDHWLHALVPDPAGPYVAASRLLPSSVEQGAVVALADDRVRLLGSGADGGPAFRELDVTEPAVEPLPPGSPLLARDWSLALGLEIDPAGGFAVARR